MKELKTLNISDDDKYQLANFWRKKEQIEKAKGRSLFTKDFKDATLKTQVLFVVMLVSIAYTFIATINYLPPVNYIIYHVCAFLGIETYSAGLFSMIFSLIITSIFTLIDPKIVILLTQMLNPDAEKNQSK